jgi:hypothetical protein
LKSFSTAGLLERYQRFKKGEPVETLLEEAASAEASRNISSKTRMETPAKKTKKAAQAG